VQATCRRAIIINKGQIAAEDTLEGLSNRMTDARRFFIKVRRPSGVESQVRSLKGIKSFKKIDDGHSFEVELDRSDDANEVLAETVVKSGAGLMEFRSVDVSLEDIFLKLTTTDKSVGGRP
jgi:ABC-2 type transport system ATP-binding protein